MQDVATAAGVSLATVSRVMSLPERVSPALRARVALAANALGYRPNPIAVTLAGARAPLIGVVVPAITHAFFAGTLHALSTQLGARGYQVMSDHHDYDLGREEQILEAFLGWRPSALVTTGVHHTARTRDLLRSADVPVVEMWDLGARRIGSTIGFSNKKAGALAATHLVARGRQRIAFAGAILNRDPRGKQRLKGLQQVLAEAGLPPADVWKSDARTFHAGVSAVEAWQEAGAAHDAIACSSDVLALGALFEAQRRGIRVPDDLAIIGYGDFEFSEISNPRLTSVRPPREEIGGAIAEHLLERLAGDTDADVVIDLGCTLMAREST